VTSPYDAVTGIPTAEMTSCMSSCAASSPGSAADAAGARCVRAIHPARPPAKSSSSAPTTSPVLFKRLLAPAHDRHGRCTLARIVPASTSPAQTLPRAGTARAARIVQLGRRRLSNLLLAAAIG